MSKQSRRSNRRNRQRTRRRRGQPPKLNLTVVTYPDSSNGLSPRREVDAVQAALLYADTVELISVGTVMLASAIQLGQVNEAGMIALIRSLDDSTLATVTGADELDPEFRPALAMAAAALQAPEGTHPVVDQFSNLIQEAFGPGMSELRATTDRCTPTQAWTTSCPPSTPGSWNSRTPEWPQAATLTSRWRTGSTY